MDQCDDQCDRLLINHNSRYPYGMAKRVASIPSPEIADPRATPPIEHWLTPPQGGMKDMQYSKPPRSIPIPSPRTHADADEINHEGTAQEVPRQKL